MIPNFFFQSSKALVSHRLSKLTLLLLVATFVARVAMPAQDGSTVSVEGKRPNVAREIPLDAESNAVLHLSFLLTGPMLDGHSKSGCRVASVLGFTTVNDHVQYDLWHSCPVLPLDGTAPIEFLVGFEADGEAADYKVELIPAAGTWKTLFDVDDLLVRTTRL